MLPKKETPRTN